MDVMVGVQTFDRHIDLDTELSVGYYLPDFSLVRGPEVIVDYGRRQDAILVCN
jgi:hypothetical protein